MYAITGTIENLDLAVILQTMNISKKTGCMEIKSGDETSRIFFEQGNVVHAQTRSLEGETAFYDLLTISHGTWGFVPEMEPPKRTITNKIEGLLLNWSNLMDEWNSIKDRLPPEDAILKIAEIPENEREHLVFNMEEWDVLDVIGKHELTSKVFEVSKVGRFKTSKALLKFIGIDLVKVEKQDTEDIVRTIDFLNDVGREVGERNLGTNHFRRIVDKFAVELGRKHNFMNNLRLDSNMKFIGIETKGVLSSEVIKALSELFWNVIDYVNSLVGSHLTFDHMNKVISKHFDPGDELMIQLGLDKYIQTEGKYRR
ncbi:MAG TPA: DUF4388 domain-containing protein [Caldisericia bacterium]|nr:DUF4388 domain-containing protein [Caldisericia bacterium]HPF48188.1 DUF4388 domain-containing protein [Caldisericia bacterium]HPI83876.1 DUF4388 domain-containing protein [Caldisericia bacterium]HPQ92641.1 DUF4388 domain-containing protein [Caldisericia bacterium]HRV74261.1 DUF4388 domain-containing protein [Caldisericia bacterium]